MNEEDFRKIAKEYAEIYFTKGIDSTKIFKYVDELEKKVEQLENIRKEAKDFIKNKIEYYNGKRLEDTKYEYIHIDIIDDLLNILNKGE